MPRFFVNTDLSASGTVSLDARETRHAVSVMRVKKGQVIDLFDGGGRAARGMAQEVHHGRLSVLLIHNRAPLPVLPVKITLAASVIKPERMELLIQKACELGVSCLMPVLAERTVVKLSKERWENKKTRWEKIILESSKQSGQSARPRLTGPIAFHSLLSEFRSYDKVLIPTLAVEGRGLWDALKDSKPKNLLVLIGPEGDFAPQEVRAAISAGAEPITLGPLVLRSETAALYVLSVLNFISINYLTI